MARTLVPCSRLRRARSNNRIDLLRRAGVEVVSAGLDAQPVKGQ